MMAEFRTLALAQSVQGDVLNNFRCVDHIDFMEGNV